MSWASDPRIVPMLTSQAARAYPGGALPSDLSERIAAFGGQAAFLGDDAAMFVRTAAMFGGATGEGVDGQIAWLDALAANAEVRQGVWTDHRGAVLYVLECAAGVPAVWSRPVGREVIDAILGLAHRERTEAVSLRNGMSFAVVETFADDLCTELALAADAEDTTAKLADAMKRAGELLRCEWSAAHGWADGRRAALSVAAEPGLLGVPFEMVCPPPWANGIEGFARRFRRAAKLDVNLYDSAPLVVAVCALALGDLPATTRCVDYEDDWWAVTRQALDAWQGGKQ